MPRPPPVPSPADAAELGAIIRRYAAPLAPAARSRFYVEVDRELGNAPVLGPGLVARTCAKIQRKFVAILDGKPVVDGR
jgi:hypothetical protein